MNHSRHAPTSKRARRAETQARSREQLIAAFGARFAPVMVQTRARLAWTPAHTTQEVRRAKRYIADAIKAEEALAKRDNRIRYSAAWAVVAALRSLA